MGGMTPGSVVWVSLSWFDGSGVRVLASHPKTQPRDIGVCFAEGAKSGVDMVV